MTKGYKKKKKSITQRLAKIESQIATIQEFLLPQIREKEAIEESRTKILISCDASYVDTIKPAASAIGIIIRAKGLNPPVRIARYTNATDSNEAELDAIYTGLNEFINIYGYYFNGPAIKALEIRSDSQLCIDFILHKKKPSSQKLINKVNIITDLGLALHKLADKPVSFVWRRRNSTFDLDVANRLAQDVLQVKNH